MTCARWLLLSLISAVALAACTDAPDPAAAGPDAGAATPASYAAPHPALPQLRSLGGAVAARPVAVPVFFAGDDAIRAQVDDFVGALGPSDYWRAVASEYGIGAIAARPSVVLPEPAPTTDDAVQGLLAEQIARGALPPTDEQTIYAVFLPANVTLSASWGTSCTSFGGYHAETEAAGKRVSYAVLPRCPGGIDALTDYTSHELIEAATDPHPFSAPGFADVDGDHQIWADTPGAEVGDMCEYVRSASQRLVGDYVVQRSWSNAAAAAGHDPCVPALPQPFIGASPVLDDAVTIRFPADSGGPQPSKGVAIPVGASKTIDVALWSDAPSPDFTVVAYDVASLIAGKPAQLTFAWDQAAGHNGDVRKLTITHAKPGAYGGSELVIAARQGDKTVSLAWGFVAD